MRARIGSSRHPIHRDVINPAVVEDVGAVVNSVTPLSTGSALIDVDTTEGLDAPGTVAALNAAVRRTATDPDLRSGPPGPDGGEPSGTPWRKVWATASGSTLVHACLLTWGTLPYVSMRDHTRRVTRWVTLPTRLAGPWTPRGARARQG
jgi:hypothetical protein